MEFKCSGKRESGKTIRARVMDNLKKTMSFEHIRTDAYMNSKNTVTKSTGPTQAEKK